MSNKAEYQKEYRKRDYVIAKRNSAEEKEKQRIRCKKWQDENKEYVAQKSKEHYSNNKEKYAERWQEYYHRTRDERLAYAKRYKNENKEKVKEYNIIYLKKYYKDNLETYKQKAKEWVSKNPDKRKAIALKYIRNHRKKYPLFYRIKSNINTKIRHNKTMSIDKYGICIKSITEKLRNLAKDMGYSLSEIITLDFHIDHIIPVSYYDLENINDIRKCWDPNNLRWLASKENMSRGNRIKNKEWDIIKELPSSIYPNSWKGIVNEKSKN